MSTALQNQEIRLIKRPIGKVDADDFALFDTPVRPAQDGEVLVKVRWLSVDTYLQERACSDAMGPIVPLNGRMVGRGLGTVVEGSLPAGTLVRGEFGWQRYATVKAADLIPVPPSSIPETWQLSLLGAPGLSAWLGLHRCLMQNRLDHWGKTLLVSSAAGTVGSIAGQLAVKSGLKVVGIAGGPDKCARLKDLGFSEVIDRHQVDNWLVALQQAAPQGIDFYFDNVGGAVLEAAVQCANARARLLLCGHSSEYESKGAQINSQDILYKRLAIEGFLVWEHTDAFAQAGKALADAAAAGNIQLDETIHHGLANAPAALRAMLDGRGIGKHLVKLED